MFFIQNFQVTPNRGHHNFRVTPYNSPGLLMGAVQTLGIVVVIFAFHSPEGEIVETEKPKENDSTFQMIKKYNLFNAGLMTVYVAEFLVLFSQTTLETIVTPISKKYFKWHTLENSYFYASMTVIFMIMFIVLNFLSKKLTDRALILMGHLFQGLAFVLLMIFTTINKVTDEPLQLWQFALACAFLVSKTGWILCVCKFDL